MTKLGSRKLHICAKVSKMGSIIGHRIDYNEVGALRGQRHIPSKNLAKYPPPPPPTRVNSVIHFLNNWGQKSTFTQLTATWISCKIRKNVGGKTHNISFQLVLQQCWKTSCTFLLPFRYHSFKTLSQRTTI